MITKKNLDQILDLLIQIGTILSVALLLLTMVNIFFLGGRATSTIATPEFKPSQFITKPINIFFDFSSQPLRQPITPGPISPYSF